MQNFGYFDSHSTFLSYLKSVNFIKQKNIKNMMIIICILLKIIHLKERVNLDEHDEEDRWDSFAIGWRGFYLLPCVCDKGMIMESLKYLSSCWFKLVFNEKKYDN